MKKINIFFFVMLLFSRLVYAQMTWTSAVTISSTGAYNPIIVADSNGNATAAWLESGVVKSSSLPIGGSWSSEATLSSTGASSPSLVVDTSGNVTALWLESGVVKSATLPFSGSWGSSVAVSSSGASTPALDVDSSGDTVAVWIRNGFVETSTKLFGMSWGLVSMLSGSNSTNPQIAIGNGTAVACWTTVVSGTNVIQAATGAVGGSWSSALSVSQAVFNNDFSKVDVDENGNALVIWYQYALSGSNYSNVNAMASYLPVSTTSWSTPKVLSNSGSVNPANLKGRIGFDSKGNAVALWSNSYEGETFAVESAIRPVSGNWTFPVQLTAEDLYGFQGDVATNAFGDAVAVYMSFDGVSTVNIFATESDIGGVTENFWSIPITLSTGTDNGFPAVASVLLSGVVNGFAVWETSDGVNNTIVAATGTRTLLLPPTSPMVAQSANNFGVFTDYTNTVSWTASTDPNIAGYIIFRNDLSFGQTDAFTFSIEDHNQIQDGSVTYGIAGFDSNRSQSTTVTVSFP